MSLFKRLGFFVAACVLAGCVMHVTQMESGSSSGNDNDLKFQREIDVTADREIALLDLKVPYSSVNVVSSPDVKRMHITGHIREFSENEGKVEFGSNGPEIVTHSTPPARFDGITIEVPPGTTVAVTSSSGNVAARNLADTDRVELKSSYGNIELRNCGAIPDIQLNTSSGQVTVSSIKSFHEMNVHSSYGNLSISHVTGDTLDATTSSGAISLADIHKAKIDAKSSYGNVALEQSAEVSATLASSSGHIKAAALDHAGDLSMNSSYGNADLSDIRQGGVIKVHCNSGTVTVSDASGPSADFSTSYGDINLRRCAFASLSTQCSSGRISQENVQVGKQEK